MKKTEKYMVIGTIVLPTIFFIFLVSSGAFDGVLATIDGDKNIAGSIGSSERELQAEIDRLRLRIDSNLVAHKEEMKKLESAKPKESVEADQGQIDNLLDKIDRLQDRIEKLNTENRTLEKSVSVSSAKEKPMNSSEKNKLQNTINQLEQRLKDEQSKKLVPRGDSTQTKHLKEDLATAQETIKKLEAELKKCESELEFLIKDVTAK